MLGWQHLWRPDRSYQNPQAQENSFQEIERQNSPPPQILPCCMKRYEIYLPLKYNNGKEIEPEKIKRIREELIAVFGALTVSSLSAPYQGSWRYGGVTFIDDIIKIEIITTEDKKAERFFKDFKEQLKRFLKQIDILITVQDIRII
ncbi:MAG: hypothetical protein ACREQA_12780 [Candidatus Binatia bacterium]